jgi:hypothetical protein
MRLGSRISAKKPMGASAGSAWLLMGTHWPLILMVAGEKADRYTSEAFFSAISFKMRTMVLIGFSGMLLLY